MGCRSDWPGSSFALSGRGAGGASPPLKCGRRSLRGFDMSYISGRHALQTIVLVAIASSSGASRNWMAPPAIAAEQDRDRRMEWWREARFGMFIHWGLYAVPAGDFEGHRSKEIGEWIMSWA